MNKTLSIVVVVGLLITGACQNKQENSIPPVFDERLQLSSLESEFDKALTRIDKSGVADHILYEYFMDQKEIIERLISGIKSDAKKPDSILPHEIPLQKEECNQLIQSLHEELTLIQQNKKIEAQGYNILNVKDFGAKGDGRTNDREAIMKAVQEAKSTGGGNKILFPSGTYIVSVPEEARVSGHIELSGLRNTIIEGQGEAELIFKTYRTGLRLEDCYNVKVNNLTIDYDPLPFTQGVITHVDYENDLVEIKIQEDFPLPDNDKFKKASFLRGTMNHPETGRLYQKGDWRVKNLKELGNRSFRFGLLSNYGFERKGLASDLKEGHMFVMHARGTQNGGPAIFIYGSSYVTFNEVNVWASPIHIAILFYSNGLKFIDCQAMPKPGTERLTCANADGFHCRSNRKGPYIKNCTFFRINDDDTNIFGKMFSLAKVKSPTEIVLNCSARRIENGKAITPIYQKGELLGFVDPNHDFTIDAFARVKDIGHDQWHGRDFLTLTLDRPVSGLVSRDSTGRGPFGSREYVKGTHENIEHFVANLNTKGNGFVIKDNSFGDHRASSIKIQSTNGLIEGNEISHVKNSGFYFCALMNWLELYPPRNIMIRNNVVDNHEGFTSTIALPTGSSKINIRPIRRLWFENNKFLNANTVGISLANAEEIYVTNNLIESGEPFKFVNCKNIVKQNNIIRTP